jgi:LacI family transcriptional regulator, galactose operon repressor
MTLQQIAERAGVSAPTISKVLNGRPDVAPATRERVLEALHEEQYLPRGASALPFAHKHIELVFDALGNPNDLEILREIIRSAAEHGGHIAVSTLPENMNARQWIHELERVGRAGVIMVTSRLTSEQQHWLQEAALPVVLIDPINSVDGAVASVGATNWRGGVTAVQHLLELGHRRIAMLRGYDCLVDDARYHGYVAALTEAGFALDSALIERADFSFEPAVSAAENILRLPDRPTGVFASNDLEALGAIEAARRLGLGVPGDLSVVGFDDSLCAATSSPQLTTVRQPFAQMGEVAYRLLTDQMEGRESDSLRVELATTLIVRESTAPPHHIGSMERLSRSS